jgi:hypothetical protein
MQAAKPSTLAGLLCGLLSPEHMRKAGPVASQAPSSDLVTMIDHLSEMSMALARAQGMHRVAAPVVVDLRCGSQLRCLCSILRVDVYSKHQYCLIEIIRCWPLLGIHTKPCSLTKRACIVAFLSAHAP